MLFRVGDGHLGKGRLESVPYFDATGIAKILIEYAPDIYSITHMHKVVNFSYIISAIT